MSVVRMDLLSYQNSPVSPAPSYISMKSDLSLDGPSALSEETCLKCIYMRAVSPASAFTSYKSAQTVKLEDRPKSSSCYFAPHSAKCLSSRKRVFSPCVITNMEAASQSPSPLPFLTTGRPKVRPQAIPSPCLSYQSDQSMGIPIFFRPEAPPSPSVSCQSNQSVDKLIVLKKTEKFSESVCSVCTNILKDPVSLQCGHSFCKSCLCNHWVNPTLNASNPCPQCGKRSRALHSAQINVGPGDVVCDICTEGAVKAVKSCLTCCASFCERHVRSHYTVSAFQRHAMVDATKEELLKQNICQQHLRALKVFCQTDLTFKCILCAAEEHTEHEIIPVKNKASIESQERHMKELSLFTMSLFPGIGDINENLPVLASDFVEVAAIGRKLKLGMLYDHLTDSFIPDGHLWDNDIKLSMTLSLPRPHSDVKILEKDSLHERLKALNLSNSLRASVLSEIVKLEGAAEYLNHPTQSQLQDQVTLHYRSSTRLDMLSQKLLYKTLPFSVRGSTTATHVVVAVLYGAEAFFVFENNSGTADGRRELIDAVKKMSFCKTEKGFSLKKNQENLLHDCTVYMDGEPLRKGIDFEMAMKLFSSFQKPSGSRSMREVPIKFWLYPLKHLDETASDVVGDINSEQLLKAEEILEEIQTETSFCQHIKSTESSLTGPSFTELGNDLSEFSSLLKQYKIEFQKTLASFIKTVRRGELEEQQSLQDVLKRHDQSPFSLQNMHQWLKNRDAEVKVLHQLRSPNIFVLKSQRDLQCILQDVQAERVLCFTLTSLESEHVYLQALKQHMEDALITKETTFRVPDTSQKILSDLQLFLLKIDEVKNEQEFMFVAVSSPDSLHPGSCIRLYQSGGLLISNVNLALKPEPLEITNVQETRVTMKLQNSQIQNWETFRVEYRSKEKGPRDSKWNVINIKENWVISGLSPKTTYQLRYAVMARNIMTDYSKIIEFCTASRAKPGPPTVLKQNKELYILSWQRAETDEDSLVISYLVEYMEAGLEGWQSFQTDGSKCECIRHFPYTTIYKARVSAIYANGDVSTPSEETKVPVRAWSIDLSKRKASIFLEVLKIQSGKKSIKLQDCTNEENEVISFLQCLPYISQLRFDPPHGQTESTLVWKKRVRLFMLNLYLQAALHEQELIEDVVQKLPLSYFKKNQDQVNFLLDLFSNAKDYEIQTGKAVLQKLQPVFHSVPQVWSINLLERKASLFLEVLTLQTRKRQVELRGWPNDEEEMRSLLHCLPYISELRFITHLNQRECAQISRTGVRNFLLNICLQAALCLPEFLQPAVEKLAVPRFKTDKGKSLFLLDLFSHIKDYEVRTGQSDTQKLQQLYQFFPEIWSINFSETKVSHFLEVLKLQILKNPLELRGWTGEDDELRSLLLCLPYISELRFNSVLRGKKRKSVILQFLVKLMDKAIDADAGTEQSFTKQLASVCSFSTFSLDKNEDYDDSVLCNTLLDLYSKVKDYEMATGRNVFPAFMEVCQSVGTVWSMNLSDRKSSLILDVLKLQTEKTCVKLTGWFNGKRKVKSFLQCLPHISQLRLCSNVVYKIASAKALRARAPLTIEEVSLVQSCLQQPEESPSKIFDSLASLLKLCNVKLLDLTEYKGNVKLLTVLLTLQSPLNIRLSEENLKQLAEVVYETQNEELTSAFLKKIGGDLSSCLLDWTIVQYFLQYHTIIVDFRKNSIKQEHIQELVPVLHRVQFKRLSSSVLLSIIREIYETSCPDSVSSLLSAANNCIHLNNLQLDTIHCAALHFTLQHCSAVSLSLLWTSIPEGELERTLPLLKHVSRLSVDRLLLLRLLHCCSGPELQFETKALLFALQHKLDFSCQSTMDLTTDSQTQPIVLSVEDCRVIATAIQRNATHMELMLHDCELEEAAVELLFSVLHRVTLSCSKALLLQFLALVHVGPQEENVRRAMTLSQALKSEIDLSHTRMTLETCKSVALVLDKSEGLSDLDLSHCQLSDDGLQLLLPQLHKARCLDISHNEITDVLAVQLYDVCMNSNIQSVCIFNNRIKVLSMFLKDKRFEIW